MKDQRPQRSNLTPLRSRPKSTEFLRGRPEAIFGASLTLLMLLFGFVGPFVWHLKPLTTDLLNSLQAPSGRHPFGTDQVGSDILARSIAAAQLDIAVAIGVTIVGAIIGMAIGVLAGAQMKVWDTVMMRIMDAFLAFPPLVLALGISVSLGFGTVAAATGITVATVPYYARLMRGEILRVRVLPFVEAAAMSGCRQSKLIWKHLLPHTWRIMAVQASSTVGYSVLTLAALGFVGLGVQPPTAEWGTMISSGLSYMLIGQWWLGTFPGVLLLLLVAGCNLIADGFGGQRRRYWKSARTAAPVGV